MPGYHSLPKASFDAAQAVEVMRDSRFNRPLAESALTRYTGSIGAPMRGTKTEGRIMAESVYKVIELVGTSTKSWEDAAKSAVEQAGKNLRDLRVAEVSELDMKLENNKVVAYRAKVKLSFKYEDK